MIKALLLDLGGTLIDAQEKVFPGVLDALRVIETFETAEHKPLVVCLVSDFTMPEPRTEAAIAAAFADYLKILDRTGLRPLFEPVDERVTLSTQVGTRKPAAALFEAALARAKVDGALTEALFITEDAGHIAAGRKLGMTALQFGVDFSDWSAAPLLISKKIGTSGFRNSEAALRPALADHGLQLQSIDSVGPNRIRGTARSLVKLNAPELGDLSGVHVELPVDLEAHLDPAGRITAVRSDPRPDDVAEAVQEVQTLAANRQIADGAPDPTSPVLPTHCLETDAEGRRVLRRRRFTAW
jgi:beta-phosphoglucomutase-like phosphatase (HAD superfamily)